VEKQNFFWKIDLQAIETILGNQSYTHNQVNQWTSQIVELCLEEMAKLNKPYKYIGWWTKKNSEQQSILNQPFYKLGQFMFLIQLCVILQSTA
jgi:hypothetical protein